MTAQKEIWLITGAGRGMGVDFAKAALAADHAVVATGRNPDAVVQAVGTSGDLLAVKLDVTSLADAEAGCGGVRARPNKSAAGTAAVPGQAHPVRASTRRQ